MEGRDPRTAHPSAVTAAYGARASAYIELFGSADLAPATDRARIAGWSEHLPGPVLDAGCGPGHWSAFLHARGIPVHGVDATPEFVAHARGAHPGIGFRQGDLRHLELAASSLGGVLAWFSLIHLDPDEVPDVLTRFTEALRPGGSVLLGFFSGSDLRPFDHRVAPAWAWPMNGMAAALEGAGLRVTSRAEQDQPNGRRTASLLARRSR